MALTTRASLVAPGAANVDVDEYALNPLKAELAQVRPGQLAAGAKVGNNPPTLFPSGDLPVVTASGVSVGLLAALPWYARWPAAKATGAEAMRIITDFTPGAATDRVQLALDAQVFFGGDADNQAYLGRVRAWVNDFVWSGDNNGWVASADVIYRGPDLSHTRRRA